MFRNLDGSIIKLKTLDNKYKSKSKVKRKYLFSGKDFTYIGRTKDTGNDIVYYRGTILQEPDGDGKVTIKYIDQSKTNNPDRKSKIKERVPVSSLDIK